jgi:PST family polysaccharide transporter
MSLIKTSFYSFISTSVSLVTKLITNKVTAIYLGTSGMFFLGQLKDFISLGKVASTIGTENGVIKYVADYNNTEKLNPFINSALKIHLLFSVLVCLITLIFNKPLAHYLFEDSEFSSALIILSFSFITSAVFSLTMSTLNGLKKIKTYVLINIIATILSSIVMIILVVNYNLLGAIHAIAINQILVFFVSFICLRHIKKPSLKEFKTKINSKYFKNLTKFSLMAVTAPVFMLGATFFVRTFINNNLGNQFAGSWEGMWRISAIYIMFLTTTFKFYLIPTFTNLDGKYLKKEVFKVWSLSLPIIILITVVVYLIKDYLIILLFSKEFLLINSIMLFHLLGDAIKINSWVLGNILISKANTKVFIGFQIGWAIVFCALTMIFIEYYGFVGVSIAYFVTYVLHFIAMNIYFRKLLWI